MIIFIIYYDGTMVWWQCWWSKTWQCPQWPLLRPATARYLNSKMPINIDRSIFCCNENANYISIYPITFDDLVIPSACRDFHLPENIEASWTAVKCAMSPPFSQMSLNLTCLMKMVSSFWRFYDNIWFASNLWQWEMMTTTTWIWQFTWFSFLPLDMGTLLNEGITIVMANM